jgi:glycosyltransferase involved in cell wall biosynthesis
LQTISALIPTYNRAALIEQAIESVLNQTYPVHEIVIVDDGSTDDTRTVVQDYIHRSKNTDPPVRYIRQSQQGAAVARNTGVAAASGDWIAFLDSDDRWLPEKIEWQVRALEKFADISAACVTDARFVNNPSLKRTAFQEAGAEFDGLIGIFQDLGKRIAYGYHGLYLQGLMVRLETIRRVGRFDPRLKLGDDSDFLFHLASETMVCYVNKPLVEIDRTPRRTNGLMEMTREEKTCLEINQYLYEKWLSEDRKLAPNVRKRIFWRLQEVHTGWSSWYLINGDYKMARRALSTAMKYNFTGKVAFKWLLTMVAPGLLRAALLKRRQRTPPSVLL